MNAVFDPHPPRVRVGRLNIDKLAFAEALDAIAELVERREGGTVFTPNVDHIVLAEKDPRLAEAYDEASLSLVDGAPVLWASRLLGEPLPEKISGSDLLLPLMALAAERGYRVYLFGGEPGVAERAAEHLRREIPGIQIVGTDAPTVSVDRSDEKYDDIVARINAARPDLLLVALGCPKQEIFMNRIAKAVRPAVAIGVGAALDFEAGTVRRAPHWMSATGTEWLYRLAHEPRRLWRRYLVRDPEFLRIILREREEREGDAPAAAAPEAANTLFARIQRSLARDSDLGAAQIARKAIQYGAALASAPVNLLACDDVGPGARTKGRPRIDNAGYIAVGARAIINSHFSPVELSAGPGGRLVIGDDLLINSGAVIAAAKEVTLGRRVSVGPYAVISDTSGDDNPSAGPMPITIGDDAWLASRVRVCKGARIGAGAVISAGSVVIGDIPPNVVAGGNPARVLRACPTKEAPAAGLSESRGRIELGDAAAGSARIALKQADAVIRGSLARLLLAGVTAVGDRPRVHGLPYIENLGQIVVGDDLRLIASPVRARLVTGKGGVLRIGDRVTIGSGASIAATTRIDIGDGAWLGPNVSLMDSDYHAIDDRSKKGAAAPIVIGENARLDEGVIVLRGAHIGRNAHITAGSVVSGTIPEGALAAGVRARVVAPAARAQEGAR